jgi:hypothetical protein
MAKKDIRLQGEAELSISADKLSADIKFRKKKEGQEWSADELVLCSAKPGSNTASRKRMSPSN